MSPTAAHGVSGGDVADLRPPRPHQRHPCRAADLALLGAAELHGSGETRVTGATVRAQHAMPGDLFAGLAGASAHGAEYAARALCAGATAVLTDPSGARLLGEVTDRAALLVHPDPRAVLGRLASRIYGEPSASVSVVGVTGTSGKTTTSYLVESALAVAGRTAGLIGTVEARIAGAALPAALTTPEAPGLQALLAVMAERGVSDAVMEVSSHALALGRVAGTRFAVGAFTNLSQDHLDFHPTMEDYFAAKAKLFDGRSAAEVVCVDDAWGQRLVGPGTVTVSTVPRVPACWRVADAAAHPQGSQTCTAVGPAGVRIPLTIPLPGTFNIANALVATAILHLLGVDPEAIASGLARASVPGRMQRVDMGQPFTALVDYAHKPAAVAAALQALRTGLPGGVSRRIVVVLGCGGDRDAGKRPMMGATAARGADLLVLADDNPRSEDPAEIRAAMRDGALAVPPGQRGEVVEVGDRAEAIQHAVGVARAGDVVLVAGKGHEKVQHVGGVSYPFSDVAELSAAIRASGRGSSREEVGT
jgi:UDP-N-acetylmuramoyl-L-alanyl-D-glutamate--2,6-diaminopimelate ligase